MDKAQEALGVLSAGESETPENDPHPEGGRKHGDGERRAEPASAVPAGDDKDGKAESTSGGPGDDGAEKRTKPAGVTEERKVEEAGKGKGTAAAADDRSGKEPAVPVARLVAERKHFQEELRTRDSKIGELEGRLKALEKPAEKAPEPPDYIDDPKGYVDAVTARADQSAKIAALEKQIAEEKTAREQLLAVEQMRAQVAAQEAEFASKTPDYYDALEHARQVRKQQLKIDYPEAEDSAIEGELTRQEFAYAFGQVQRGANPAERAYQYARTLGYTPKEAAAAAKADGGKQDATTQARDESGKFAKPDAAEIEAASSLGSGGGDVAADEADLNENDMFEAARKERFGSRRA